MFSRGDSQRRDEVPPPWEEDGYWESLLTAGETIDYDDQAPPEDLFGVPPLNQGVEATSPAPDVAAQNEADPAVGDWQLAESAFAQGSVQELDISGYNRGGLLVRFHSLTGFVPASHLVGLKYSSGSNRQQMLQSRVGSRLNLRIIELDRERSRLILSERAAHEDQRPKDILTRIRPDEICTGQISNICHFGAFVDLGGIEGLIHVSEMSWGRVGHPGEVLELGQQVSVYVMDVDLAHRKVALSLKRLTPDPWHDVDKRYQVGELVDGVVTNVVGFGAFVRLEEGLEGLIHISELAEGTFLHPRNVVQENSTVTVRILSIDPHNRRLALSLRQPGARVHSEPENNDIES